MRIFRRAKIQNGANLGRSDLGQFGSLLRFHSFDRPGLAIQDEKYVKEFIWQKKTINKIVIPNRRSRSLTKFDRVPFKYFYYYLRTDPLFGSYMLDKLINTFAKGGRKLVIRRLFYKILDDNQLSVDALYYIVETLRPTYLNVVARRGREIYRAPILASYHKSVMKAIKFFKKAVMSRSFEDSLEEKIANEILDYLF